ncbi:MAG: hypothetical protein WB660_06310 [Candidatus Sulfotelmatobacter sp.]
MAAATPVNRQWRLKSRPTGLIKADNFELVSQPMPVPEEAQLLIRSVYLSLDPAMRGWLIDRPSYVPPVTSLARAGLKEKLISVAGRSIVGKVETADLDAESLVKTCVYDGLL